jgi:hypothetical protein
MGVELLVWATRVCSDLYDNVLYDKAPLYIGIRHVWIGETDVC